MTVQEWREWARADAKRRQLPELEPLLESMAALLETLRTADFNPSPTPQSEPPEQRSAG